MALPPPIASATLRNLKTSLVGAARIKYINEIIISIYDNVIITAKTTIRTTYEYLIPTDPRARHQSVLDFTDENIAAIVDGLKLVFPDSKVESIKENDEIAYIKIDWS